MRKFIQLVVMSAIGGLILPTSEVAMAQLVSSGLDFGSEYAGIGYTDTPQQNPIAHLIARLERGEFALEFESGHLHLEALLAALNIDPGSQILVYSRTSLQTQLITAATPRAIYFNDSTYVAWIPGTSVLEIVTTDAALGPVFYTLEGKANTPPKFERHTGTCLICHDTYNGRGGGVPLLMVKSTLASKDGTLLGDMIDVTDNTALEERWGGWYVTGHHGRLIHRGNILLSEEDDVSNIENLRRGNLATLEGFGPLDTSLYLRATSDIAALLVLEHQLTVQNQITYVKFKAPAVLERSGLAGAAAAESWSMLPPKAQSVLTKMLERLTQSLLLAEAAEFSDHIVGTSGFGTWFQSQGPKDIEGRSLRDLDLQTHLFRYPLSYLIYSPEFEALPAYAKDYVYLELADALKGDSQLYAHLSREDRAAIKQILLSTKPDFARY